MFVLFNALDHACGALPVAARLGLYGLIVGVLAMLIYWLLAPQTRIIAVREEMAAAQKALRAYTGTDPREILRLSGRSISPAVRQLLLLLVPTLVATAPVLLVMDWLESAYAYRLPAAGDSVTITIDGPAAGRSTEIRSEPRECLGKPVSLGRYIISWPAPNESMNLLDAASNQELVRLPLRRPSPNIERGHWWSRILEGSDRVDLPQSASISAIEFGFPPRQFLSVGPGWMRSWQIPFMLALSVAALAMKFAIKIV
jgi:hypothetical protein